MVDVDLLQELLGFLHDKNPQVRTVAAQELVPYSSHNSGKTHIFSYNDFTPLNDLKLLILDGKKTAHDSLTILINLSKETKYRSRLTDDLFLQTIISIILDPEHGLSDLCCMILSNIAKQDEIQKLATMQRPSASSITSPLNVIDQLLDIYTHSGTTEGGYNKHANYDFLTNLFSDLTRFASVRTYFFTRQAYDGVVPLSKVLVFSDTSVSQIRRTGVASTLKNCCFDVSRHGELLDEEGLNALLYLLTPLCGPENAGLSDDEIECMFESLQFLESTKRREPDEFTMTILLDALLLLCTTKQGRNHLRRRQTYPIIRQLHLDFHDSEEVSECCEKLVNMLMRDDEGEDEGKIRNGGVKHGDDGGEDSDDDDDQITEV